MKVASVADVEAHLSAYLTECAQEGPVVITRDGEAVAVLVVPVDEDDLERLVLARSPRFQALLNKSRQSIKAGKGLSRDEFWEAVRQRHHGQDNAAE
jgi:antitoxin (DNA-binding transcriptional repressor) of toxin-antitoxin stability system